MIRWVVLAILLVASSGARADERVEPRIDFQFRTSEISNLVYELDCLASTIHCSRGVFVDQWKKLGWSKADDDALAVWGKTSSSYVRSIDVGDDASETLPALPDEPRDLQLEDKLRLAAFGATDPTSYRSRLALVVTPVDAERLAGIVELLLPRFHPFWAAQHARLEQQARELGALLHRPALAELCARAAHFYGAAVPSPYTIAVNLVALPKNETHHSKGTQLERDAVIETEEGEHAEDRVGVVLHELFHHFYTLSTAQARDGLVTRFAQSPDAAALVTYGVLNEALTTALGNGLVERALRTAESYRAYLGKTRSFYDDAAIDLVAKGILPALEKRLATSGTLYDDDFVAEYVGLAHRSLGPVADRPAEGLRTMVAALLDPSALEAFHRLRDRLGGGSVWSCVGNDARCRQRLTDHAQASGVVFIPATWVPAQLEAWAPLLGRAELSRIAARAKVGTPFVAAVHRTPKSTVYVFVASTPQAFSALVDRFLAATTRFDLL